MKNEYFRVGVISSAHGIKGEVNVFPTTDDPKRFEQLEQVYIDNGKRTLTVEGVKYFKNTVIVKFKEIPDRTAAELYRTKELYVDRAHAAKLNEGEYFVGDVIGSEVYTDEGEKLGIVSDVLQTAANDVFEIKLDSTGKTVLFPNIKECILNIDIDNSRMTVHVMKGLM